MRATDELIGNVITNLGFEVNERAMNAREVSIANQFMPFFNRSIDDESTWRNDESTVEIDFDDLHRITSRSGQPRFPNIKSLKAVVNPQTSQILKISSPWPENTPPIAGFPDAPEEERQMKLKAERFESLPAITPPVDFYAAMKQLDIIGPVSPQDSKQVIAYLVNHSTVRYSARPVWIIQTRGIDLVMEGYASYRSSVPADARNHMRSIIDATTGEWLYSDTTPQPVSR